MTTNNDLLNTQLQDQYQVNNWEAASVPCDGISLADLRLRLRYMLSNYKEDTLIPSDAPDQDIERQWINDGIGQLWPHDWQPVMKSYIIDDKLSPPQTSYILPDDAEQVLSVMTAKRDINNTNLDLKKLPHYDAWTYDSAFIDAVTMVNDDGLRWIDQNQKAVVLREPRSLYRQNWLVVRYARRWPFLVNDYDCINPTANRVMAIVFFAAAQYFASQFQVSTESIRYQNYIAIGQRFQQMAMQQLIKDSKPLYFS